jgi:outer membrane protein assembly factor BamB
MKRSVAASRTPVAFVLLLLTACLPTALPALGQTQVPVASAPSGTVVGWTNWRGPNQDGVSPETNLPAAWQPGTSGASGGVNDLWSLPFSGRSSLLVAQVNGQDRVYAWGYAGEGADLREVLLCVDASTGKEIWRQSFNDFLSDIIYSRYSIGAPAIDRQTGNVYVLSSAGQFLCFSSEGKKLWEHSMMEEYGRLTFPNGRTGTPVVEDDLVIVRSVTSNWGAQGAPADRFYAFDKLTGHAVWSSTPGVSPPKDNAFATPVLDWWDGHRVFYTGTGCGHVVAVNARTGQPLWRIPTAQGGMNASVLRYKDTIIAGHNDENVDTSEMGRMMAIRVPKNMAELKARLAAQVPTTAPSTATTAPATQPAPAVLPAILDKRDEVWRNPLQVVTSSPVLVGNRIYQLVRQGDLECVDADTGAILWHHKLAPDQLHASPVYGDGKLYVPMTNGLFYILKIKPDGVEELAKVQLEGNCLGAPAIWRGRVYVLTTDRLYAFGPKEPGPVPPPSMELAVARQVGAPVSLRVTPSDALLTPGRPTPLRVQALDATGHVVPGSSETFNPVTLAWRKFVPPGALVRAEMDASVTDGKLTSEPGAKLSAGMFEGSRDNLKGTLRGRVVPDLPYAFDFDNFTLSESHKAEKESSGEAVKFAYPPLPWIGARFRWEVRADPTDTTGKNKVLTKTIDNMMMQRAQNFLGRPEMSNYTMQADVMSEGTRRNMSSVGLVHQRYLIQLLGNWQQLEITSNADRIKVAVDFKWVPKVWYTIKTRVDVNPDGSGVVRAKAWKRGEPEPANWLIEAPHTHAHTNGAPGIFGFALQNQFRVYIDNLSVTANP